MKVKTLLRFIVFLFLTSFVMLFFYTTQEKNHYQRSSEQAIHQILSEISSWQKTDLFRHLAPETKQTVGDAQLEELLNHYRGFGRFNSIDELGFSRMASAFSLFGEKRINYSGAAYFDVGLVNLNITLVERDGFFLVYNFSLTRAGN